MLTAILFQAFLLTGFAQAQETPAAEPPPLTNLVKFFDKCRAKEPVTVAYIGGSITEANGWRPFTSAWLRQQFPETEVKEIAAAIGGTGSFLGAFRLQKDVLDFNPDLVFVEFAVNDNGGPGSDNQVHATMEGIVRQIWTTPKQPPIVFTYTTAHNLDVPIYRHQDVADAYRIPTVDFQAPIKMLNDSGIIDWSILAGDRVHPGDWGHSIYAATLATFLKKQMALTEAVTPPAELPTPFYSDDYARAYLVAVTDNAKTGWEVKPPSHRFDHGSIIATEPGATIEFNFTGTMVGIYYRIRQNAGIVKCEVDGQQVAEVDTSWGPIYPFDRLNCSMLAGNLAPVEHTLRLTMTDRHQELSKGYELELGYLMVAE